MHVNTDKWRVFAVGLCLTGSVFLNSGCGNSRAKGAQSPPPPSLSAPVRADEERAQRREIVQDQENGKSLPADEYAFLAERQKDRVGARTPLPVVKVPPISTETSQRPPVGVAPAEESSAQASEGEQVYTVKKGDTLYGIARKFNLPPKELIAANGFKDPNSIGIGTQIRIPDSRR